MSKINLTIINLHNETEFQELLQQRTQCGWDHHPSNLDHWRQKQDEKLKSLFWITLDTNPTRIGHVSLDAYATPPDPELALSNKTILTIQTFFILPSYQSGGLGGRVMDLMEEMATKEPYGSPDCKIITVNTLSEKSLRETIDACVGVWERDGVERPAWSVWSKEVWYRKRGYVKWKEEARYESSSEDADVPVLHAAFLRKTLR